MKKLSFILLIFISILKVEGVGYKHNYYYEHSNKAGIVSLYKPAKIKSNFPIKFSYSQNQFVKKRELNKNNFKIHKSALLYYNEYIVHQFKINNRKYIPRRQLLNFSQRNDFHQTVNEDPFQLS